ncbi:translation initiation factor [Candidatus Woesearchaeota archaeon]|nr:translation initiation factor [Candidatus Woesearchaeota archaeon]
MSDICSTCGLPKELCVCETIAKESQKISVDIVKKKFGKISTIVSGINETEIDLKELAKKLKSKLACGGTAKDGHIELQGNHGKEIRAELIKLGFSPDQVEVNTRK